MKTQTIVVFDFDGTITKKDSFLKFIEFSKGRWWLFVGVALHLPQIIAMKCRLFPNWKAKQALFSFFFKSVSYEKFNYWGDDFCSEIDKIVRSKALDAINFHKCKGDSIIIVSASIENWISPWAARVGADMVIATKIEKNHDGKLTGKFFSKNCYGQEKVNRLLEVYPNRNDFKLIVYGDSRGDKELLEFSDLGYLNKFI